MPDRLEIQFDRPLASVATVSRDAASLNQEQVQLQMQEQINAELAEFRTARNALTRAHAQFQDLNAQFCNEAEQQLLGLSLEIARKVLMQEIKAERHEVDPIVREALSRLPGQVDAVVLLHPADLARCELAGQDQDACDIEGVSFVADDEVRRGECLVRTLHGTVESSIDGHIDEIAQALTQSE